MVPQLTQLYIVFSIIIQCPFTIEPFKCESIDNLDLDYSCFSEEITTCVTEEGVSVEEGRVIARSQMRRTRVILGKGPSHFEVCSNDNYQGI